MKSLLLNPKMRFCLALGASMGIGHALFRAMTTNLGAIWGLIAGLASIAAVAAVIALALEFAAKHAAHSR